MDREMLQRHLEQTEVHLAASDKLIADQRALLARLEQRGFDIASATGVLGNLEELRKLHVADRDRLLGELGKLR